jgi:hypothetical protein
MKRKGTFTVFMTVLALLLSGAAYAGSLDSAAAPNATNSYTLEDLYNRLDTGTDGAQSTFTEPAAGPGSTMHTVNEVMGRAPEKDNTDGAVAADVAAGKTFWGLNEGAGEWGPQTGTAAGGASAGVPRTGQTVCYNASGTVISCTGTGQDGELQEGAAWPDPRFTDNGNGTVTDNLTGLIWLKDSTCFAAMAWEAALTACNSLASESCGLTDGSAAGDWHLPNKCELESLLDYSQSNPALPAGHPFAGNLTSSYWSSTTYAMYTDYAWYVNFSYGGDDSYNKSNSRYVRAVRSGQ